MADICGGGDQYYYYVITGVDRHGRRRRDSSCDLKVAHNLLGDLVKGTIWYAWRSSKSKLIVAKKGY